MVPGYHTNKLKSPKRAKYAFTPAKISQVTEIVQN